MITHVHGSTIKRRGPLGQSGFINDDSAGFRNTRQKKKLENIMEK